jgi:hypothetical protein
MGLTKTTIPRGEEVFVFVDGSAKGCLWRGLYQFQGSVFWKERAVVFGIEEWAEVSEADRFEMVNGSTVVRMISGNLARSAGRFIDTPNGPRWAVPVDAWS